MGGCNSRGSTYPATEEEDDTGSALHRGINFMPKLRNVQLTNPWLPLLTPGQLVEINEAFGKFDVDGDGTIVCDELKHVMRHMGLVRTKEQIEAMIASTDVDGNGKIEFDEFVRMMAGKMLTTDGEAELEQAFKLLDADSSGYVTESEIRNLLTKLGSTPFSEAEVQGMLALGKPDEQGRISYQAFRAMPCWAVPAEGVVTRHENSR